MLSHIESLAILYVYDRSITWIKEKYNEDADSDISDEFTIDDNFTIDDIPGFMGHSSDFRYGDLVELSEDNMCVVSLKHGLVECDPDDFENPPKYMEVWKTNPTTGYFMYTGYWRNICWVWLDHKYREMLINNLSIIVSGSVKIPMTYITINGIIFYIYACNRDGGDFDVLYDSSFKNSDMMDVKKQLIKHFVVNDKAIYLQKWPGFDDEVTQQAKDDFFKIIPADWEKTPVHNVLWAINF